MLINKALKVSKIIKGDDDVNRLLLIYAIDDEELEVLFYIIEKLGNFIPKVNQSLKYAASEGKVDIMKAILNRYNPSPASIKWEDILITAATFGQVNVIREFIQYIFEDKNRTKLSSIGLKVISETFQSEYFDIIYLILSSTKYPEKIANRIAVDAAIYGNIDLLKNTVKTYNIKHISLAEAKPIGILSIYEYLFTHLKYTPEEVTNNLYLILNYFDEYFPEEVTFNEIISVFKKGGADLTKVLSEFITKTYIEEINNEEYLKDVIKSLINNGAKVSKTNYDKIKDILNEEEKRKVL